VSGWSSAAGRVHDDGDAKQADQGTDDVVAVGAVAVEGHAPGQGAGDEHAAIGGKDPAEVRIGLQGGDEAVEAESDDSGADEDPAAVFADSLPDQPGAADLGDRGQYEQRDRLQDEHEQPFRMLPCSSAKLLRWWCADCGSATTEITLITPVLVMLLVLVGVVIHRGVDARLRLDGAAHQAARAAGLHRTMSTAVRAAQSTAASALTGESCQSVQVETTGTVEAGGTVKVTISCSVDYRHALLLGIPGEKRLSATSEEPIDIYRSSTVDGDSA
jgi:hypothetical protein